MYRYFLAFRYVLSRPINLLGMIGIALGVWSLIVVIAIFSGFLREAIKHVSGASSDISVLLLAPSTQTHGGLDRVVAQDDNVVACTPRVVWHGLLVPASATRERSTGIESVNGVPGADSKFVTIIGVDPTRAADVSGFGEWLLNVGDSSLRIDDVVTALAPRPGRPHGILVSTARAEAHDLSVGSRAKLSTGRVSDGSSRDLALDLVDAEVEVRGAFSSGFVGFDGFHVFMHIDAVREILGRPPGWANELAVKLHDPSTADQTKARIRTNLNPSGNSSLVVRTAIESNLGELSNIDHQTSLMKLVLFVIMLVAGFLVFATLSMMVTEKTHDIGILTALGASRRGVMAVFLACGTTIAVVGTVLGVITGCISAIYTNAFNHWLRATFEIDLFPAKVYGLTEVPCELDALWIGQVSVAAILLGVFVSGIPAWRAARHDPLQSLRNE